MAELKVIENEIVPVYETEKGIKVVNGRELHEVLESKQDFSTWVKRRLAECDAEENEDFELLHNSVEQVSGTKYRIDYIIKLDTAKEMAMLERNDKGKQVRKYFIAVEKKYKKAYIPASPLEQLQLQAQAILQVNEKVDTVKKELEDFKYDLPLLGVEMDKITNAVKTKGTKILGGKSSNAYKDNSLRAKVYKDIHGEIRRQFGVTTYKAIKRNQCETAIDLVNDYKPPIYLEELTSSENAQQRMFS